MLEGDAEEEGLRDLELLLEFLEAETTSNLNFEFVQVGPSSPKVSPWSGRQVKWWPLGLRCLQGLSYGTSEADGWLALC